MLIATKFDVFCGVANAKAPAPHLTHHSSLITHLCLTPFLFDTNKTHRIIILVRALMKTKEKQFSIRYKFAHRGTATLACPERTRRGCALRFLVRALRHPEQNKCAQACLRQAGKIAYATGAARHESPITTHQSPITTQYANAACLGLPVMLSCPAASGPNWFARLGMGA
jgi:hypothetical protein